MRITQTYVNDLVYKVIGAAIEVHKELGPGLLESVYQKCLLKELQLRGVQVLKEVKVPICYKGEDLNEYLRIDLLINDIIVVEIKAVDEMSPIYQAQLLTYLKLTEKPKGLLINFNALKITGDLTSLVTENFRLLPKA